MLLGISRYMPRNSAHGIYWGREREINFSRLIPSEEAIIKRQIFSLLQIVLNSMHRYQPRIHLVRCRHTDDSNLHITDLQKEEYKTFIFPEAIFTAVTAYQNQLVSSDVSSNNNRLYSAALTLDKYGQFEQIAEYLHREIEVIIFKLVFETGDFFHIA